MFELPLPSIHKTPRLGRFALGIDLLRPELLPREFSVGYRAFSNPIGVGFGVHAGPMNTTLYFKKGR